MSDPYLPPAPEEPSAGLPSTGLPVPDSVVSHFALIRPWARACSVAGLVVGIGLAGVTLLGLTGFSLFNLATGSSGFPPVIAVLILATLLLGGFIVTASIRLWAFSASIDQLCQTLDGADLEVTVHLLHRFWRSAGIAAFFLIVWMILAVMAFSSP